MLSCNSNWLYTPINNPKRCFNSKILVKEITQKKSFEYKAETTVIYQMMLCGLEFGIEIAFTFVSVCICACFGAKTGTSELYAE